MTFQKNLLLALVFLFSLNAMSDERAVASDFIKIHNLIRNKLKVGNLEWSNKIANFSKEWADYLARTNECKMKHRPREGPYSQLYGENIFWASATVWTNSNREIQNIIAKEVVNSWVSEVKDYNYSNNTCKQGEVCGHYTQVVWKKTKKLGCSMSICPDKGQIWVCNYNPPGNYIGEKPY